MFNVFREKTISLKFHTQKKKFSKNKGKIKIFSDKVQGLYCQQDHTRYKKKKKKTYFKQKENYFTWNVRCAERNKEQRCKYMRLRCIPKSTLACDPLESRAETKA